MTASPFIFGVLSGDDWWLSLLFYCEGVNKGVTGFRHAWPTCCMFRKHRLVNLYVGYECSMSLRLLSPRLIPVPRPQLWARVWRGPDSWGTHFRKRSAAAVARGDSTVSNENTRSQLNLPEDVPHVSPAHHGCLILCGNAHVAGCFVIRRVFITKCSYWRRASSSWMFQVSTFKHIHFYYGLLIYN